MRERESGGGGGEKGVRGRKGGAALFKGRRFGSRRGERREAGKANTATRTQGLYTLRVVRPGTSTRRATRSPKEATLFPRYDVDDADGTDGSAH